MSNDRLERERTFHDHAFERAVRTPLAKYYAVARESSAHFVAALDRTPSGSNVLEYGCGEGSPSLRLANRCNVTGVDISPIAVAHAREEARRLDIPGATFVVMDAERLAFPDASFDTVCGNGILHHLDLERAFSEVARVLTTQGLAVFTEPLGHNPLINAFRRRTPQFRSHDEHPLLISDLAEAKRHFGAVECRYFSLSTLAAVPLRGTKMFGPALRALELIDQTLFRTIPPVRRLAWIVLITCREPRSR